MQWILDYTIHQACAVITQLVEFSVCMSKLNGMTMQAEDRAKSQSLAGNVASHFMHRSQGLSLV